MDDCPGDGMVGPGLVPEELIEYCDGAELVGVEEKIVPLLICEIDANGVDDDVLFLKKEILV